MAKESRHELAYKLARTFACSYTQSKFNYHWQEFDSSEVEGPYIVLSNHTTDFDPLMLTAAFPKHMYFVAADNIMQMGFKSKLLMRYFKPILRVKGKKEIRTVSEILKTLRGGNNVCIFAEGNRTFNGLSCSILPSTGKMVKKAGVAMVTFRLKGGYFSHPRWSRSTRKGQMDGSIVGVYSAEEIRNMSDDEVNSIIVRDLHEDAYETQAALRVHFKGENLALGLERALFYCPKCKRFGSLHSDAEQLSCECGYAVSYSELGYLIEEDGTELTITSWDVEQREALRERFGALKENEILFDDAIRLRKIGKDHLISEDLTGQLAVFRDRFEICGKTVPYDSFEGISVFKSNILMLNCKDENNEVGNYELTGDDFFCALKYIYVYELALGTKQI